MDAQCFVGRPEGIHDIRVARDGHRGLPPPAISRGTTRRSSAPEVRPVTVISQIATDVVIIGGGPAGLGCAIALGQQGVDVTLVERRNWPVDKACGEG